MANTEPEATPQAPGQPSVALEQMIQRQLIARDIRDPRVLEAFRRIPREPFVPEGYDPYADGPAPIGCGQTVSQPYIVARMSELLEVQPGMDVLEIGTGSGYQAAILAAMGAKVFGIERHAQLAKEAAERLASLGFDIDVRQGDGSKGWPQPRQFDRILSAAGAPEVPQRMLKNQLADGGLAVMPIGPMEAQRLYRIERKGDEFDARKLDAVRFVPLIGEEGWEGSE